MCVHVIGETLFSVPDLKLSMLVKDPNQEYKKQIRESHEIAFQSLSDCATLFLIKKIALRDYLRARVTKVTIQSQVFVVKHP